MAICISPSAPAPCLLDPLSVGGLRRLQRDHADWAVRVARHLPDGPDLATDPTVRDALSAGVLDFDALQRLGPHAFRRHRQAARHAVKAAGQLKLSQITDDALQVTRRKLECEGLAPESITRSLTLLRRLARLWAAEAGQEARVTSKPTRRTTNAREPGPRVVLSPEQVAQLLAALRDRGVRVAVALVVGCGLHPGEVLHLAQVDVDLRKHLLAVHGADRSKPPRLMVLAPWCEDVIKDHVAHWTGPPSPWLLPSPRDRLRPRGDVSKLLQTGQRAVSELASLPPVNLRTLRRTWVSVALHGGLPDEAARGTWKLGPNGALPPWWPRLRRLARGDWKTLCGLDRDRWPSSCGDLVPTSHGLLPVEIAEARRPVPTEPPTLPPSALP